MEWTSLSSLVMVAFVCDSMQIVNDVVDPRDYRAAVSKASFSSAHGMDDSTAIAVEFLRMKDKILEDRIGAKGDYFLGYLKGRLRVAPPKWWSDELRDGVVRRDRLVLFKSRLEEGPWRVSKHDLRFSGVSDITIASSELTIRENEATVTIRRRDFQESLTGKREAWQVSGSDSDDAIAAAIDGDAYAIAFQCPVRGTGQPARLFLGNVKTGTPVWNARVTKAVAFGGYSGDNRGAFTQIVIDGNRVILYGSHTVGLSIQIFERETGKNVFMFASGLLESIDLKRDPEEN